MRRGKYQNGVPYQAGQKILPAKDGSVTHILEAFGVSAGGETINFKRVTDAKLRKMESGMVEGENAAEVAGDGEGDGEQLTSINDDEILGINDNDRPKERKPLKTWLIENPELLKEVTQWYNKNPEWWSINPDKTIVFYRPPDEVKQIRMLPGEKGGHHPHGLALGGPIGQKLTHTGESARNKNPMHSRVTSLQRKVINQLKQNLKETEE